MAARAAVAVLAVVSVLGWGVAAGLGAAVLVLREQAPPAAAGPTVGGPFLPDLTSDRPEPAPVPSTDMFTLTVHSDGCGVIRSEGPGGAGQDDVTWVVTDADGFQVMGANGQGETHYRYYVAGTYEVVLESWGGEYYVPVSNTVTITC